MFENRKYAIVTIADLTDEMLSDSIEKESGNLRKSLDNTKTVLKWDGNTPSSLSGLSTLTYSEVIEELAKDTWTEPEE
mgnify:CR=1 FL=1|tara:strand:+ start:330 stop:563 length:234 start_codon:yes stop_codon:yes gene_type:complete